ncbi:hypothetical protein NY2A_b452R [Paramecium bursaria Chlorella virus NY2A]|uniref:Uncharacterized protein b452R n=1 Tax=Paramecium bursaria Chlorella virus NY2A TaxID=46021 RepID=A7IWX7_PBCVN|nr:hypothetical protein NY2A_b452R [Paramecium bursaria Chlorella virus NY2A]ABT14851.1 hypothetical protein NY2A_b452R [Paramecium bursaria Chlorella virus NY2A]
MTTRCHLSVVWRLRDWLCRSRCDLLKRYWILSYHRSVKLLRLRLIIDLWLWLWMIMFFTFVRIQENDHEEQDPKYHHDLFRRRKKIVEECLRIFDDIRAHRHQFHLNSFVEQIPHGIQSFFFI